MPKGRRAGAVPLDDSAGDAWIEPGYNDSTWTLGTTGVGFDNGSRTDYDRLLGLDLDSPPNGQTPVPLQNVNQSVYIRVPFQLDSQDLQYDRLQLRMMLDDGFVAYLNGQEVAHANAPGRDGNTSPLIWYSARPPRIATPMP